jgi:hypothetical protein
VNAEGLLPAVVARLEGESLNVKVEGAVGYSHGQLTVNFTSLPDVPLSRARPIVNARILVQNGRTIERRSSVHVHCRANRRGQ